jgi:hypothetical protein
MNVLQRDVRRLKNELQRRDTAEADKVRELSIAKEESAICRATLQNIGGEHSGWCLISRKAFLKQKQKLTWTWSFLSCYTNNVRKSTDDIIYNLRTIYQVGVILCVCQINLYLTGLYGVRKHYIGFQYGIKFAEQTVSFLYMNEFGGWANQLRS